MQLREIDGSAYRAWYEGNRGSLSGRGPFHEPAWLEAAARGTRFGLGYVGTFEGPELVTVVPGFLAPRGPIKFFGSPLRGTMTSYLGPVSLAASAGGVDDTREAIEAATAFVRKRWHAIMARFTVRDAPTEHRPALGRDWHEQHPRSYRLDLTIGEDALFAGLKSHCRRNVRKASREGVEIVPVDDPELFVRVLSESFRRHDAVSWQSERFFSTLMHVLPEHDLADVWGARYDDRIIAVGLFLRDEREMHFIAGGSMSGYGSLPTSYLLHWHAIASAARAGLAVFNSEASRIPSIDHFKETFNPRLERRSTLIWARSPVRRAEASLRRWNKRVRALGERIRVGGGEPDVERRPA